MDETNQTVPAENESDPKNLKQAEQRKPLRKYLMLIGIICICLLIIPLVLLLIPHKTNKKVTAHKALVTHTITITPTIIPNHISPQSSPLDLSNSNYCFINLFKLYCLDQTGKQTIFDLPQLPNTLIANLIPSPNQQYYLAVGYDDMLYLCSKELKVIRKLGNAGDGNPYWTGSGKNILFTKRQKGIFSYTIATGKVTQLTTEKNDGIAFVTDDNKIVYSIIGEFSPYYIMNANGTDKQVLFDNTAQNEQVYLSYDPLTNTIIKTDMQNAIVYYEPWSGTLVPHAYKTFLINTSNNNGYVQYDSLLNKNTAIIDYNSPTQIQIIHLQDKNNKTNNKIIKLKNMVETPIGVIADTITFTKSTGPIRTIDQGIFGLSIAPKDFATYIKKQFAKNQALCSQEEYTIKQIYKDQFAVVSEGCNEASENYYVKQNNNWISAFETQQIPSCDNVNKFAYTKKIVPQCINANGQYIDNTNP